MVVFQSHLVEQGGGELQAAITDKPVNRVKSLARHWRGWLGVVLLPAATLLLIPPTWPRWAVFFVSAASVYAGLKWLSWIETPSTAPLWRHLLYLFLWPGMDAAAFLNEPADARRTPSIWEWLGNAGQMVLGAALFLLAVSWSVTRSTYVVGLIGQFGFGVMLLFGFFGLLSCFWRSLGLAARPLMNWPALATSVADYWGRHWNTAFRDLNHRFVFQPVAARFGRRAAMLAGFLFSGVVHDLVISLPAGGGYGGPTLFFLLQSLGVFVERGPLKGKLGPRHPIRGWLFTMLVLVVPMPLLFHAPFVRHVVLPFLQAVA